MILLEDLTDGETSDTGPTPVATAGIHNIHRNDPAEVDFDENTSDQYLSTNNNTLETMSARSFGFVKPSPKQRESDFANRLRRHKSFFNAETSSSGHMYQQQSGGQGSGGPKHRRGSLMRRAESFHHSRSLGDFDQIINGSHHTGASNTNLNHGAQNQQMNSNALEHLRSRGKSVERLLASSTTGLDSQQSKQQHQQQQTQAHQSGNKPLSKSKSMEFLKAKLLSRKPSTKLQQSQPAQVPQTQEISAPSPPMMSHWDLRSGSPGRTGGGVQTTFFSSSPTANQSAAQWGFQMDKRISNGDSSQGQAKSSSRSGMQGNSNNNNRRPESAAEQREREEYDWRQDTPFWNKQGRWARPAPAKKSTEEPWVNHQSPPMPAMAPTLPQAPQQMPMHHQQQQHHHLPTNRIPGWPVGPSTQYPGVMLNRKMQGSFYPSFPVAGVSAALPSHNVYLPQVQVPSHFVAGGQPGRTNYVSTSGSSGSPAHSNSGSSSSGNNGRRMINTRVNPLRNNLDLDTNDDSLPSRLEITELSDEEPILPPNSCPTPDYSTMPTRPVSPGISDTTVILVNQNGSNQINTHTSSSSSSSNNSNNNVSGHRVDMPRRILDMPSGLY